MKRRYLLSKAVYLVMAIVSLSATSLAIAQDLARRSGGSVSLRDNPGGGLRAELRLPR